MQKIRIATWNLKDRSSTESARGARLREWTDRVNADVWVLTEARNTFSPSDDHVFVAESSEASDLKAAKNERWVTIWVRRGFKVEVFKLTRDTERVAAAQIRFPNRALIVVGTVLPWQSDAAFLSRLSDQTAEWQGLIQRHDVGLCVAGDYNQDLLSSGHYFRSAAGRQALSDALEASRLECLTGGARDPLTKLKGLASIDHICVGGMPVPGSDHVGVWPPPGELTADLSDHYGVWADLEIT